MRIRGGLVDFNRRFRQNLKGIQLNQIIKKKYYAILISLIPLANAYFIFNGAYMK